MKLFNPFKPYIVQIGERYYVRVNWFAAVFYDNTNPHDHQWITDMGILTYASHSTLEEARKTLEKVKNNQKEKFIEQ